MNYNGDREQEKVRLTSRSCFLLKMNSVLRTSPLKGRGRLRRSTPFPSDAGG